MLSGSPFYCARATILGIFPLSAGSRAVFQVVGLCLLVIVEEFCMLYWGILPLGLSFRAKI